MNDVSSTSRLVRFGPFEVDLESGQLRKGGVKVRLQEQPFRVLSVLIERPGEVVTRDELRKRLWSDDTFVEFEQGLNTAVNRLRSALSDSANDPRWIETVPRRGYRFAADGTGSRDDPSPAAAAQSQQPHVVCDGPSTGIEGQVKFQVHVEQAAEVVSLPQPAAQCLGVNVTVGALNEPFSTSACAIGVDDGIKAFHGGELHSNLTAAVVVCFRAE